MLGSAVMSIERVTIRNLRGIREGSVEGLSPLSVLVGPNNAGKSTVLEALLVAHNGFDAQAVWKTLLRRGGPVHHAAQHVLHGAAREAVVGVEGVASRASTVVLSMPEAPDAERVREARSEGLTASLWPLRVETRAARDGAISLAASLTFVDASGRFAKNSVLQQGEAPPAGGLASFVDVDAVRAPGALEDAYSRLESRRRVARVVRSLQRAMPTLSDLRILKVESDFVLHAIHGDAPPVPAYLAGDGFKRFLEVASAVYAAVDGGVVLLEEPESFQHPRYLGELATVLRDAASLGAQVVLSTHSLELIDLLLLGPEDGPAALLPTVHRLRLTYGVLRAVPVPGERARYAREALAEDLRV